MKKILSFVLAVAAATLFISCDKSSSPQQQDPEPTPTPKPVSVSVRFYVAQELADLTDISFVGQFNGSSEYVPITTEKVEYVENYDSDIQYAADISKVSTPLVIYQYNVDLYKGTHKVKMIFNRNSASTQLKEVDVFYAMRYVKHVNPKEISVEKHFAGYIDVEIDGLESILAVVNSKDNNVFAFNLF